ncbi:MAG: hydrogenase expression/formation protein HypE [Candidatus Nitrosothermus koennekii]|nr:MAG: hydrogenase expression/formation protein HypE [Candidatus Nitrosothermus koennekii]
MNEHILKFIKPYLKFDVPLNVLDDAGVYNNIVISTDTYTIKPLFFNGGDIGRLAISGTVNDISVIGGKPIALSLALIIEEGFSLEELDKILESIDMTCKEADVDIITGDTKVVEKGALDKLMLNTSGIGIRNPFLDDNISYINRGTKWLLDSNIKDGDKIIISGSIADHGMSILSAREGYEFESDIRSDVMPLNKVIDEALRIKGVVSIKDPTRGGIANLLNEWSEKSNIGIMIYEDNIPIKENVRAACSFLGLDPLEIGNEGKICLAVTPEKAEKILDAIKSFDGCGDASIIGEATNEFDVVAMRTIVGGTRIISKPAGDPVPRIC